MPDYVVDTNVLLVASAAHPFSPFDECDLTETDRDKVLDWLSRFHADQDCRMVWDRDFRIYDEYRHKLGEQDYGLLVVHEKMGSSRQVDIEYDLDTHALVPGDFADLDNSDRKFLAVVLADDAKPTLANATDTDWLKIETRLADAGIQVEHIIETWLRGKHAEKESRA
jgi:hypothetical protein